MSDLVRCIECSRYSLRTAPEMARLGFGRCDLDPKFKFRSAVRPLVCEKHRPAESDAVAARREWLRKYGATSGKGNGTKGE